MTSGADSYNEVSDAYADLPEVPAQSSRKGVIAIEVEEGFDLADGGADRRRAADPAGRRAAGPAGRVDLAGAPADHRPGPGVRAGQQRSLHDAHRRRGPRRRLGESPAGARRSGVRPDLVHGHEQRAGRDDVRLRPGPESGPAGRHQGRDRDRLQPGAGARRAAFDGETRAAGLLRGPRAGHRCVPLRLATTRRARACDSPSTDAAGRSSGLQCGRTTDREDIDDAWRGGCTRADRHVDRLGGRRARRAFSGRAAAARRPAAGRRGAAARPARRGRHGRRVPREQDGGGAPVCVKLIRAEYARDSRSWPGSPRRPRPPGGSRGSARRRCSTPAPTATWPTWSPSTSRARR